jgi:predicted MFS family arabinose efflux permease
VPPEDLVGAIGLASTQWNLGRILGPTAAAIAIAVGGVPAALWVNAASFLVVIAAVLAAPVPRRAGVKRTVRVAVRDALAFVRTTPPVRAMLPVMTLAVLLGSPFMGLSAQMATNVFGADQHGTSLLVTAQGIGAVVAGASMGSLVARWGTRRVLTTAAVVTAPVLVLYGLAPSLWSAALTLVVLAGCYMATLSSCTNITQRSASAEVRGRAMIVNNFVLGMAYPVGVLLQGELADRWSLRAVTVASGVSLGVCLAVLAVARPRLTDPIARLDQPTEVAHVH